MWINKLIYFAVLLYAGVLSLLYTNVQSLYVFLILLLFGGLQAIIVSYLKHKVDVHLEVQNTTVNKNEPMKVGIVVENKALIPISCVKMIISYENEYEHLKQYQTFSLSVNSNSTHTINFTLSSVHTGAVRVGIKKVVIYDFLRVFHRRYKRQSEVQIKVFPEVCMMESDIRIANQDFLDSDVFSKIKSGDDPSEVFDIREYKEGDKIHRIHWKLSSKRDIFMVKEYSLPIACNVGIMVSMQTDKPALNRLEYYDALLSTISSISYQLSINEQIHFIAWYDEAKDNYRCFSIEQLDDIYNAVYELLEADPRKTNSKIIMMHDAVGDMKHVAKLYYICGVESKEDQEQLETLYPEIQVEVITVGSNNQAEDTSKAIGNLTYQYIQTEHYKQGIEALQL